MLIGELSGDCRALIGVHICLFVCSHSYTGPHATWPFVVLLGVDPSMAASTMELRRYVATIFERLVDVPNFHLFLY